jgi:hypothetical protein
LNLLHQISDPLPPAVADPAVAAVVVDPPPDPVVADPAVASDALPDPAVAAVVVFVVVTVFVILKILFTI